MKPKKSKSHPTYSVETFPPEIPSAFHDPRYRVIERLVALKGDLDALCITVAKLPKALPSAVGGELSGIEQNLERAQLETLSALFADYPLAEAEPTK